MTQWLGLGLTVLTLAMVGLAATSTQTLNPYMATAIVLVPQLAAINVFLSKPS